MGQHLPLSPRAGGDGMREATLFYCLYIVGSPCRPAAVLFTRVTVYVNDSLVLRENLGVRGGAMQGADGCYLLSIVQPQKQGRVLFSG